MGPSCYIEYRGIQNRTIRGFYCTCWIGIQSTSSSAVFRFGLGSINGIKTGFRDRYVLWLPTSWRGCALNCKEKKGWFCARLVFPLLMHRRYHSFALNHWYTGSGKMFLKATKILSINICINCQGVSEMLSLCERNTYHQTSNMRRTLVGIRIFSRSDAVGASPVSAAPTTFLTYHLTWLQWIVQRQLQDQMRSI